VFVMGGDHVFASHNGKLVTREVLAVLVEEIKGDCSGISSLLIYLQSAWFFSSKCIYIYNSIFFSLNCNLISSLIVKAI
jgi:hypothetical protein